MTSHRIRAVTLALLVLASGLTTVAFAGSAAAATSKVDVVFVFDTSGSMGPYQTSLADDLGSFADELGSGARYAVVDYEDPDDDTFVAQEFTSDPATAESAIRNLDIDGGGEYASDGILVAFNELDFREDAQPVIVVVTDEDDQSSDSTRSTALDRIDSENGFLVSISPDGDDDDDLKTMSQGVENGEWFDIDGDREFSEIIDELGTAIKEVTEPIDTNTHPDVEVTPRMTVQSGDTVTLNGSESEDPDGEIESYEWETGWFTDVELDRFDGGQKARFTAPDVSGPTTLTFKLTVTDDDGSESDQHVSVFVEPAPDDTGAGSANGTDNATAGSTDGDTGSANGTNNATAGSTDEDAGSASGTDNATAGSTDGINVTYRDVDGDGDQEPVFPDRDGDGDGDPTRAEFETVYPDLDYDRWRNLVA